MVWIKSVFKRVAFLLKVKFTLKTDYRYLLALGFFSLNFLLKKKNCTTFLFFSDGGKYLNPTKQHDTLSENKALTNQITCRLFCVRVRTVAFCEFLKTSTALWDILLTAQTSTQIQAKTWSPFPPSAVVGDNEHSEMRCRKVGSLSLPIISHQYLWKYLSNRWFWCLIFYFLHKIFGKFDILGFNSCLLNKIQHCQLDYNKLCVLW